MPAVPINQIFGWNTNVTYSKWDPTVVQYPGMLQYFFSTKDSNVGANPNSLFVYSGATYTTTRTDNVMRITFGQSGTTYFQPGSVVNVYDITPDSSANYTGLVLAAGPGYVDYISPGLNTTNIIQFIPTGQRASFGFLRGPRRPRLTCR